MTLAHKVGVQRENLATMDVDAKDKTRNVAKDKTVELVVSKKVLAVHITEQVVVPAERAECVATKDVVNQAKNVAMENVDSQTELLVVMTMNVRQME